jgi:hypothetical protein
LPVPTDVSTTSPGDEHQRRGVERVGQVGDEALGIGSPDLSGLTDHDHPAVHQERRCRARVDDGTDVELVHSGTAELLHHHRRVASVDQSLDECVGGLCHE